MPVPDDVSDEDAAQYLINPFTAVGLVDSLRIPEGEFLLQTAAGALLPATLPKFSTSHFPQCPSSPSPYARNGHLLGFSPYFQPLFHPTVVIALIGMAA